MTTKTIRLSDDTIQMWKEAGIRIGPYESEVTGKMGLILNAGDIDVAAVGIDHEQTITNFNPGRDEQFSAGQEIFDDRGNLWNIQFSEAHESRNGRHYEDSYFVVQGRTVSEGWLDMATMHNSQIATVPTNRTRTRFNRA